MTSEEGHRTHKYREKIYSEALNFIFSCKIGLVLLASLVWIYISKENAKEWEPGDIFCPNLREYWVIPHSCMLNKLLEVTNLKTFTGDT